MSLADWIKEQGLAVGFDDVGIAPAADLPELAHFLEWLAGGHAGQMDYMNDPRRRDVRALLPEARSVICCALSYDADHPRSTEVPHEPECGWLSRYAWGDDYHGIVREKLEALRVALAEKAGAGFQSRVYVDTGPVLERVYAHHAGLGWLAKNTCLLDAERGSFFFLGVLITNLELEIDTPPADGCGACTLCLEACPTGALVAPYQLDARRCISYLTIELRAAIPEEFRQPLGRHVFGCDICQDVCPYNQRAPRTSLPAFQPRDDSFFHPQLERLAALTEEDFRRAFKNSPVKRAKHRGLLRNTLVAMGNARQPRFRPLLEKFAASDDPLLAEHARWALDPLNPSIP
jgi:epoxyqueuosine reductase